MSGKISQIIFMIFFYGLLSACGIGFIDKPIQTMAIMVAVLVALNLDKIK